LCLGVGTATAAAAPPQAAPTHAAPTAPAPAPASETNIYSRLRLDY
jgi:hypothetical protein